MKNYSVLTFPPNLPLTNGGLSLRSNNLIYLYFQFSFASTQALLPILYQGAKIQKSFTFYALLPTFYYLCEKYNTNYHFFYEKSSPFDWRNGDFICCTS